MKSGYGGAQREMHPKNINQEVGYLGLHGPIIDVGYYKHILFQEGVNVPFYMTPQDLVSTRS